MLAPAQDGHPVAHRQHLVQLVGDDDDGLAVRLHAAQHVKQPVNFLGRQHGGGLVQDQNVRPAVQHLDNFHRLLFGYGHIVDFFLRVQMKAVFFRDLRHLGVGVLQVVPAFLLHAQHDVFRGGKQIHQFKMLMDHADAVTERVLGRTDHHFVSVHKNLAFIREINPRNHVHQGGFPAAVFP